MEETKHPINKEVILTSILVNKKKMWKGDDDYIYNNMGRRIGLIKDNEVFMYKSYTNNRKSANCLKKIIKDEIQINDILNGNRKLTFDDLKKID